MAIKKRVFTGMTRLTGEGRLMFAKSDDEQLDITLSAPKEMNGPGVGSNPEQTLAAAYAACVYYIMREYGELDGIDITGTAVDASVSLGPRVDGTGNGFEIDFTVNVPMLDQASAERLYERAHVRCPFTNAMKGNVDMTHEVHGGA